MKSPKSAVLAKCGGLPSEYFDGPNEYRVVALYDQFELKTWCGGALQILYFGKDTPEDLWVWSIAAKILGIEERTDCDHLASAYNEMLHILGNRFRTSLVNSVRLLVKEDEQAVKDRELLRAFAESIGERQGRIDFYTNSETWAAIKRLAGMEVQNG